MNINRHNYEEFFLLYTDGELSAPDRIAVEKFVAGNPDLEKELEMLTMTHLQAEPVIFENKEALLKKESGITLTNYSEYFLLLVDNELNDKEAAEVEKFVLQHPALQAEFTLLKLAKLEPEPVVFRDKEVLYKKEKRRIVPLFWMRMSVAAALLGIIATTWLLIRNGAVEIQPVAVNPPSKQMQALPNTTSNSLPSATKEDKANVAAQIERDLPVKAVADKAPAGNRRKTTYKVVLKEVAAIDNKATIKKAENKIPQLAFIEKKIPAQTPVLPPTETAEKKKVLPESKQLDEPIFAHNDIKDEQPLRIINTAYREVDNSGDDRTIFIGNTEINKNKLKGLFKKAAGLFDKKQGKKDDDRSLQIAGFDIKS